MIKEITNLTEEALRRVYDEMMERAARGVEDSNPADDEPIIDRIDLSGMFCKENCRIISGLAYKLRHHHGMSDADIAAFEQQKSSGAVH